LTWQLVSPLRWERDVQDTDFNTGYPTESIGRCTSEHFAAFAGTCAAFIGFCLAYALVLSYKTRHMSIEWTESKYIAASVFYLLQLLLLGVPILVLARESTNSYYMVLSLILFLMSFGTSLLIFVPKVIARRKRPERRMSALMTSAISSAQRRSSNGSNADTVEQIQRRVSMSPHIGQSSGINIESLRAVQASEAAKMSDIEEEDG